MQLGDFIYVGSGYEFTGPNLKSRDSSYGIHSYNTVKKLWDPHPIEIHYCWFAMTAFKDNLLIVGGKAKEDREAKDQIFKMDANGQLELYTKMNTARYKATAIGYKEILLVVGGQDNNETVLSSTELFDSNNNKWHTCSDLPIPHCILKAVIVNSNLYLLGGVNQNGKSSPKVFVASMNALSRHGLKWNTHKDTPYLCSTPVCVNGTHVLILGGSTEHHHDYTSDVYRLDQDSESWIKIGYLPFVRNLMAAVSMDDGSIIAIGGTKNKGVAMNTVWKGLYNHPQHQELT